MTALALVAASCASSDGDDDASSTDAPAASEAPDDTEASTETEAPEETEAPTESEAPDDAEEPTDTEAPTETEAPDDTEAPEDDDGSDTNWATVFPDLGPPSGEEMVIGLVNTEGVPGLDFPDIRNFINASADYLNQHGGVGDRPITVESCTANGSPEGSQACAQELTGKNVELVIIGLDVFPDYTTYEAAGTPLVGMLPLTPIDNTAPVRYLTGGNVTTNGTMAAVAVDHFGAETVGIVSADNVGANATLAGLEAALGIAGIEYTVVKGGDNETDAGYQGLMRQAADGDPDLLISLYADAGCIGTMRGRAALGIEIPVLTTAICADSEVIAEVGDDALGWNFAGIASEEEGLELDILREVLAPAMGGDPADVDPTALGLGGLGFITMMSVATYGNQLADTGGEVTGAGIYDFIGTAEGLTVWPGGPSDADIQCGAAPNYPAICAYTNPVSAYTDSGEVLTVPGLEKVDSIPYLP
ncbi:ABC transporter substrate-binding protein [Ilumatobacter nonamiensis]|uniref:ABC transporter substrate-binding protein n=1 Tax=Ilumatobacter nonamiensis TaxID=467093 RepID=UPI000686CB47|nr:ABC transporter substrate-binding protein [Ilumatobacter nonamiensis]